MERCPTCGAAVRPGARFCTSCGSRIEEQAPATAAETQDTIVATPAVSTDNHVTPEPDWEAASGGAVEDVTGEDATMDDASWSSRWPEPRAAGDTTDSPADRFRDALDSDEPDSEPSPETTANAWSWDTPDETAGSSQSADTDEVATESETITPEIVEAETGAAAPEATIAGNAPESDPRRHASKLIDELRGLIWQIGGGAHPGANEKNVIQNISRVRGETGDFADLEPVIAAVRDNPRDIDALRDLGQKAPRLNDLLESHKRLVTALEDALKDQ